jgi:NAD(P)-dependent dehydrogenase (short-subunit alcohol dehydrogenase family)
MRDFKGKTAFITGGGAGIGLAMARTFAGEGMRVAIADMRQDHLEDARQQFKAMGHELLTFELDVTDRSAMEAAASDIRRRFGPLNLLCNNAGVNIIRDVVDATYEDFDWMMAVNFGGCVNSVKAFLPDMLAHGDWAHIVNTSSTAGVVPGPGTGPYSAAKFAIRGFTTALRYDLMPHGIGVSVLCPGTTDTKLYESEENRLKRYEDNDGAAGEERRAFTGHLFREVLHKGMSAEAVAERTAEAVKANEFYIFPHAEFKAEFKEQFDEILSALPKRPPDPDWMELEDGRRQRTRDVVANAKVRG